MSGHGYIETQNASLMSLVVGDNPAGHDPRKPSERYAMFAEVYGPFREDSMELREETAYQRGMMEHIRENMENLRRMNVYPSSSRSQSRSQSRVQSRVQSPMYNGDEGDYPSRQTQTGDVTWQEGVGGEEGWDGEEDGGGEEGGGEYNRDGLIWDELSAVYKPRTTYVELAQRTPRKPPPSQPKTYTEILNEPKTYSEMATRGRMDRVLQPIYYPERTLPQTTHFEGYRGSTNWGNDTYGASEDPWSRRTEDQGRYATRDLYGQGRATPRFGQMPPGRNDTMPLQSVRLPAINTGAGYQTNGYRGNGDSKKVSIDINLSVPRKEDSLGQSVTFRDNTMRGQPVVPPLALTYPPYQPQIYGTAQYQQITTAPGGAPAGISGGTGNTVTYRQSLSDRPGTAGRNDTVYPYLTVNNPWFPKENHLPPPPPTVRQHYRRGKYGMYRVFDINDYKKMQKELRLGSMVGAEKDTETLLEKKEKRAVIQEYGKLIRAKNHEEMKPRVVF